LRGNLAKISTRGQITVPVAIRRALGVDTGDILAFEKDHKSGFFRVRPVRSKGPLFIQADRHPRYPLREVGTPVLRARSTPTLNSDPESNIRPLAQDKPGSNKDY